MNASNKALWFIESHFQEAFSLDDVAGVVGVSRYHVTRAFSESTGHSLMRYVRRRRLSEAARRLIHGAPDILAIALDSSYASHEAFTRAFRDEFGITPEALREQGASLNLKFLEPLKMDEKPIENLEPPRFEKGGVLLVAGLNVRYTCDSAAAIPSQWQKFVPHIGRIPGEVSAGTAYGVRWNTDSDGNMDYLCGVEVTDFSRLPAEFSSVRIPEQEYAVFQHRGHVSEIRRTWATIWNHWLPASDYTVVDAPDFEKYGPSFDGRTGLGGLEIWVPVVKK